MNKDFLLQTELLEAVVIGSGFGGAVSFGRLAQKWKGQVLLLERGKRYPLGSFPRSPQEMAANFWSPPGDQCKRPKPIQERDLRGMFDVRNYKRMDAVVCAGLGGGSLIYANVFLEPPEEVFAYGWPRELNKDVLKPYYKVVKAVLGARTIPSWQHEPRRRIVRTELYEAFARNQGRQSSLADLCVFFGNDPHHPTPIGLQEKNRYGATQTSCTYCGECDVGCNTQSKNTLDLNYLYVAEHVHKGRVQTDCQAEKLVPLNKAGQEDNTADGTYGYRVYYKNYERPDDGLIHVDTRRVVVSAGTLGSNELLLRCRYEFRTLPLLSSRLGHCFSGNGDFVSFVVEGNKSANPNYGPVITQYIDYNLFNNHDRERAFILQDASYPAFAAWFVEGLQPALNPVGMLKKIVRVLRTLWDSVSQKLRGGKWSGSVGNQFYQMLKDDISYRSSVLLCMGLDKGDGVLTLRNGNLELDWPQQTSMPLYQAIVSCGQNFKTFVKSWLYTPLPTWNWPMRNNITVHSLGGCILADSPEQGVVSSSEKSRGQVFGYHGLYVSDGSVLPGAVGANPSATIAAVAEWIAEGITGNAPTADLGGQAPDFQPAPPTLDSEKTS